jgi:hypothetical protein
MNRLFLNYRWLLFISAFLVLMAILFVQARNTASDPQGTLLVSEAIAQRGIIKLDAYETIVPKYSQFRLSKIPGTDAEKTGRICKTDLTPLSCASM